jgi:nucleoside-diphosphate-sugar epimerase
MRIILVGASGFLGRNILLKIPRSWEVVAIYRSSESFLQFLARNTLKNVIPIRTDLRSVEALRESVRSVGDRMDAGIIVWGNTDIQDSIEHPLADIEANVISFMNVLEVIRMNRVIYLSSGAVYLGNNGIVDESSPTLPKVPYGISKLAAELYLQSFAEVRDPELRYVIFRFFGAYGPYEPERKIYTKLVRTFGIRKERQFRVRGTGTNLIDAMYVDDAVEGIVRAVTARTENTVVNFATGSPMTIDELVRSAAHAFGIDDVEIIHEGSTPEPITFIPSTHTMSSLFNFQPSIPLETGLRRLYEHLVQNHDG